MHQSHNIPWSTVVENVKVKQDNPYLEGQLGTNVFRDAVSIEARNLPSQAAQMKVFVDRFIQALAQFSQTERAKYPTQPEVISNGKMFSNAFVDRYGAPSLGREWTDGINKTTQDAAKWLQHVPARVSGTQQRASVGLAEDFNNALIILIENAEDSAELTGLMSLARHPTCDLAALASFWAHADPGWRGCVANTLSMYIMLNVLGSIPELTRESDRRYLRWPAYYKSAGLAGCWNFDCLDRAKSDPVWLVHIDPSPLPLYVKKEEIHRLPDTAGLPRIFDDLAALKQYLKRLWRSLYRYHMLCRELAMEYPWEATIITTLEDLFGFRSNKKELALQGPSATQMMFI